MATKWGKKDPRDIRDYAFDWTLELPTGVTVSSAVWTVLNPGSTSPLTVDTSALVSPIATVRLSGGVAGVKYDVQCEATLSDGQRINRKTTLTVKDR